MTDLHKRLSNLDECHMSDSEEDLQTYWDTGIELTAAAQHILQTGRSLVVSMSRESSRDVSDTLTGIHEVLDSIELKQVDIEHSWEKMERNLDTARIISDLEKGVSRVTDWILGPANAMLNSCCQVGFDVASSEELRMQHEKLELECRETYGRYAELLHKIDSLPYTSLSEDLKCQRDFMDFVCRSFASRLERRRNVLITSQRFFRLVSEYFDKTSEVFDKLVMGNRTYDFSQASAKLSKLEQSQLILEALERELVKEGEKLSDILSMPVKDALGRDVHVDYGEDIVNVRDILDATNARKNIFNDSVELQKLSLKQVTLIYTYENDAEQAIKWLNDLYNVLLENHMQVGCNANEIQSQKEEHQSFQETAKGTYDYGCQLVNGARVLRLSCRLPLENNGCLFTRLREAWKQLRSVGQEQLTRLRVCAVFHRSVEEHCSRLRDLIETVGSLRRATKDEDLAAELRARTEIRDILGNREKLLLEVGRMVRLGRLLRTRLKESMYHQRQSGRVSPWLVVNEILIPVYRRIMSEAEDASGKGSNLTAVEAISAKLAEVTRLAEKLDARLYEAGARTRPISTPASSNSSLFSTSTLATMPTAAPSSQARTNSSEVLPSRHTSSPSVASTASLTATSMLFRPVCTEFTILTPSSIKSTEEVTTSSSGISGLMVDTTVITDGISSGTKTVSSRASNLPTIGLSTAQIEPVSSRKYFPVALTTCTTITKDTMTTSDIISTSTPVASTVTISSIFGTNSSIVPATTVSSGTVLSAAPAACTTTTINDTIMTTDRKTSGSMTVASAMPKSLGYRPESSLVSAFVTSASGSTADSELGLKRLSTMYQDVIGHPQNGSLYLEDDDWKRKEDMDGKYMVKEKPREESAAEDSNVEEYVTATECSTTPTARSRSESFVTSPEYEDLAALITVTPTSSYSTSWEDKKLATSMAGDSSLLNDTRLPNTELQEILDVSASKVSNINGIQPIDRSISIKQTVEEISGKIVKEVTETTTLRVSHDTRFGVASYKMVSNTLQDHHENIDVKEQQNIEREALVDTQTDTKDLQSADFNASAGGNEIVNSTKEFSRNSEQQDPETSIDGAKSYLISKECKDISVLLKEITRQHEDSGIEMSPTKKEEQQEGQDFLETARKVSSVEVAALNISSLCICGNENRFFDRYTSTVHSCHNGLTNGVIAHKNRRCLPLSNPT
ncbi:hypothetical protein KM043_013361 [Ampulex compressa]|nr:hypothetical protein KM043_013361 [Ampulex compressa]